MKPTTKRNLCYTLAGFFALGVAHHANQIVHHVEKREEALEQRVDMPVKLYSGENYDSAVDYHESKLIRQSIGLGASLITGGVFIGLGIGYHRRRREEEK